MIVFLTLALLFIIGSCSGWVLEVFYRKRFSASNPSHRWVNPGFCTGPCLPLYGSGLCILYLLSELKSVAPFSHGVAGTILLILLMALCMTLIEFISGILCIKVAKVRLWDYSKRPGNIMGVICPEFSIAWGLIAAAYFLWVHQGMQNLVSRALYLSGNIRLGHVFLIGLFYGVFAVDLANSYQLLAKMKAFAEEHQVVLRYEQVKVHIQDARKKAGQRVHFLFPFHTDVALKEHLMNAREAWEVQRKRIIKK